MAYGDYRHCDICDVKTFYDANLAYETKLPEEEGIKGSNLKLLRLGDWKVLCVDCAKTHECVIIKKEGAG